MHDSDPVTLFDHAAAGLRARSIAYLHVIEPRIAGNTEVRVATAALKPAFGGPLIAAGGFDSRSAEAILTSGDADLVAFGRQFISNPDLPERLRNELPLDAYDRLTFYYGGATGYVDFPLRSPADHVVR